MALCNVTGLVYLMDGSLARSRVLVFQRDRATLAAEYLGTTVPQPVFAKTDPDGEIDVDLLSGAYEIKLVGPRAGYLGRCVVPDAATARLEDIIDADALPDAPPVWLGQVIDARDAAEDAADRAEDAAASVEGAETAINEAQLRKNTLDATRAPLPSDDASQGYAPGSRWLWQGQEWVATSVSAGAARWLRTNEVTPQMFGAVGDGVADDSDALEAAFTSGLRVVDPAGSTFRFTRTISALHPLNFAGTRGRTTLLADGMGGFDGLDGINLILDGSTVRAAGEIRDITVKIIGGNGGTFFRTPKGATARGQVPKYVFSGVTFLGGEAVNVYQIQDYAWACALDLGDGDHHTVTDCVYYGSYDPTLEPTAANIRPVFVRWGGMPGEGGLGYPTMQSCRVIGAGRAVDFTAGIIARPKLDKVTIHNCWDGIVSDAPGGAPAEVSMVDCDVNTQHRSVWFDEVSQLAATTTDTTRAPGMFDHALGWTGWHVGLGGFIVLTGTRALDPNTGTPYTTTHRGYDFYDINILEMFGTMVRGSASGQFDDAIRIGRTFSASLVGTSIQGITQTGVRVHGPLKASGSRIEIKSLHLNSSVVTRLVTEGSYSRQNVWDDGEPNRVDPTSVAVSAEGSENIVPGAAPRLIRRTFLAGSGAYVYDIHMTGAQAREGDHYEFSLRLTSANATVRILDAAGNVQVTLNSPSASTFFNVKGLYIGTSTPLFRIASATESLA